MSLNIEDKENVAISAREEAWKLYQSTEGWTQVNTNIEGGAVVEWRTPDSQYFRDDGSTTTTSSSPAWKCWRVKANIEASMETVISVLMDYDNMAQWNPALSKTQVDTEDKTSSLSTRNIISPQVLARPKADLMLTYQVTSGQRPVVNPRDFVFLVSVLERDGVWLGGGCSISLDSHPASPNYVRAWQYPTGMVVTTCSSSPNLTEFCWILQCDFSGSLPPSLLNLAMPYAIKLFVNSLRKRAKHVQSNLSSR